jgi:hypothetical protein
MPENILKILGEDIVTKLEFVSHISGIIGMLGIILATVSGILDAGGANTFIITDINIILIGISNSLSSSLLTYKIVFTIFAFNMFMAAGVFKLYFVNYRGKKHLFQNNIAIQVIYLEAIIFGFFSLILIGSVGGIISSGSTVLSQIPVINELLPGGNPFILGIYLIMPAIIAVGTIFVVLFSDKRKTVISYS